MPFPDDQGQLEQRHAMRTEKFQGSQPPVGLDIRDGHEVAPGRDLVKELLPARPGVGQRSIEVPKHQPIAHGALPPPTVRPSRAAVPRTPGSEECESDYPSPPMGRPARVNACPDASAAPLFLTAAPVSSPSRPARRNSPGRWLSRK